jgi:acyl carrier protein
MSDLERTVMQCFENVFPTVAAADLATLSQDQCADWDSVAHVTLVAALSEALDVELDFVAFAEANTHAEVLAVVRAAVGG